MKSFLSLILLLLFGLARGQDDDADAFFKSSEEVEKEVRTTEVVEAGETTTEAVPLLGGILGFAETSPPPLQRVAVEAESGPSVPLSEQIRAVLDRYRSEGVVALPGTPVPDPMTVPDFKKSIAGNPIQFKDMQVYGLSNLTIDHINTDLDKMEVYVALETKRLVIVGNYSIRSWLSKASGPFNATLLGVEAGGAAAIGRSADGSLTPAQAELDMSFQEAKVRLEGAGVLGPLVQGLAGAIAPALFEALKPALLNQVEGRLQTALASRLASGRPGPEEGPAATVDKAVAYGRNLIRENGWDPLDAGNRSVKIGPVKVKIIDLRVEGLSRLQRVGSLGLALDSGRAEGILRLSTGPITGNGSWEGSVLGAERNGSAKFRVARVQARAVLSQSLDTRRRPRLDKLDLHLSPVNLDLEGGGSLDYLTELAVNAMPAIFRHAIVDALEPPLTIAAQAVLNHVDVEALLNSTLPELDNVAL